METDKVAVSSHRSSSKITPAQNPMAKHMTYEAFLDEVTTLITEKYDITDEAAIRMVMRAQEDEFFSGHDDDPKICTLDRAHRDAAAVFKQYGVNS
jgi:hypothetical protein